VTEQLVGRTAEVQATIAALTERLARLHTEETALQDERFEKELRHSAGEFTEPQWEQMVRASDARIERIASDRASTTVEIQKLQQILSMAGARGAPPPAAEPALRPEPPALQPPAPVLPRSTGGGFDELEFLKSVVDTGRVPKFVPGGPRPAPSGPPGGAPNGAPSRSSTGVPVPGQSEPSAPAVPAYVPPGAPPLPPDLPLLDEGDPAEPAPPGKKDTGGVPTFLRDVPREEAKTLKCAGCGAMNLPTEWYCERCGSELAAM
jgi:hypothetical protein